MLGLIALIGAGVGLAKGVANAHARDVEYQEKLKDLKQKQTDLTETFNNTVFNAAADLEEANTELNARIADTTFMRDRNAGVASKTIVDQQAIADMEMADLQVEAAEAMGSAVQNVAMSGTRRMTDSEGNVMNAGVFKTEQKAASIIGKALAKNALSFYSSAEQAKSAYLQADMNIAAYQREIATNGTVERDANGNIIGGTGKFGRTYDTYKLTYDQNYRALDDDIKYMEGEGRTLNGISMFTDMVSGLFGGISWGANF